MFNYEICVFCKILLKKLIVFCFNNAKFIKT